MTHCVGEGFPAVPVVFGATVFNGDDGVFFLKFLVVGNQLGGGATGAIALFEDVLAGCGVKELGRGHVEGDKNLLAELVSGLLDGFRDGFESVIGAFEVWSKPSFVSDGGGEAAAFEYRFECMENFGARAERIGEALKLFRDDHELLEVNRGVGVSSAVEDVHHRDGQDFGIRAADVFEEGLFELVGSGVGRCEGDR